MTSPTSHDRPLRRDAARNRARILEAAGELFAERGLSVHLNDVARHAGVGVGTVYRHFPNKDRLIEMLFEARVDELVAVGEAGLADPDPWHGLASTLERSLELQASNRGLHQLIQDSPQSLERLIRIRSRLLPLGTQMIARAQAAGAIRPDISTADIPLLQMMVGTILDAGREVDPEIWRRYLQLVLRGIATHPEQVELPENRLTPDDIDQLMSRSPALSSRAPGPGAQLEPPSATPGRARVT